MLNHILDILVPLFSVILIGYALGRYKFPWAKKEIGHLILQVALPCLIIHQLANDRANPVQMLWIMAAAALVLILVFGIGTLVIRLAKMDARTYVTPTAMSNMSVGIAIGLLGFGNSGLALCIGYAVVVLITQFSAAIWCFEGKITFKPLLKRGLLWASVIALIIMFSGLKLPSYVDRSLEFFGHMAIPLLLLSLGFALSEVKPNGFGKAMLYSGLRLGLVVGASYLTTLILGLTGETRTIVLLLSVLPSSTINVIMARDAGCDMDKVTIYIFCTNIWMAAALPVAMWLLL